MKARFAGFGGLGEPRQRCLGARCLSRAARDGLCVGRARDAGAEESLYTRCLSSLPRRDPERPGDYRLPAAAEGQPQRRLPGSVRAVTR